MRDHQFYSIMAALFIINCNIVDNPVSVFVSWAVAMLFAFLAATNYNKSSDNS